MTDWETRYYEAEANHTEANGMLTAENERLKRLHTDASHEAERWKEREAEARRALSDVKNERDEAFRIALSVAEHNKTQTCAHCGYTLAGEGAYETLQAHATTCPKNPLVAYAVQQRDALERARGCIKGLIARTPVRDVSETLAEIDAALAKDPAQPALGSLSSQQTGAQPERTETGTQLADCHAARRAGGMGPICDMCAAGRYSECRWLHQSCNNTRGSIGPRVEERHPDSQSTGTADGSTPPSRSSERIGDLIVEFADAVRRHDRHIDQYTIAAVVEAREAIVAFFCHQVRQQCACDGRHPDGSPRGNCSYPLCDTGRFDSQSVAGKKS